MHRQHSQILLERGSSSRETEARWLLIEGCALLAPGEAGGMLYNQDVLIVGKYIQDCGPSGTLRYDAREIDQVIEGKGRLAMAGLNGWLWVEAIGECACVGTGGRAEKTRKPTLSSRHM